MTQLYIYTHDMASEGAKALGEELGALRIRRAKSRFKGSANKTVVNWGNRALTEEIAKCRILNNPDVVRTCSDKLAFFRQLEGSAVSHVPFTTDQEVVKEWLEKGHDVVARTVLNGSGGEGLKIFNGTQEFVQAPLYTQYIKKKDEYRVHVVAGKVVDVQRKALKLLPVTSSAADLGRKEGVRNLPVSKTIYNYNTGQYVPNPDYDKHKDIMVRPDIKDQDHRVRNLANGYIFMRNEITPPDDVLDQAKKVFDVIPLDFGAVDVIWNEKRKTAYVIEVNTAPGLEGTTVKSYADALKSF